MEEPTWIRTDVVLAIHNRQLAEHGGAPGIRNQGLIDSSLAAPRNRWLYQRCCIEELGACYAFHLVRNHPFIDGNKRTAFVCMRLFLKLNGLDIDADPKEKIRIMIELSAGKTGLSDLALWIKARSRQAG
ncbi:MAG: type II toxin-antitoxin system death-on-curing family toxin [Acidobacteria bacterium]|nr:type II toxin-antitoxin system death-on-curing family toxin [Acidobacteriota bacterium]